MGAAQAGRDATRDARTRFNRGFGAHAVLTYSTREKRLFRRRVADYDSKWKLCHADAVHQRCARAPEAVSVEGDRANSRNVCIMAARRAVHVAPITNSDEFKAAVDSSDAGLVVVDVHEAWCGPCTVLEPSYRKLALDLDRDAVKFFAVPRSALNDEQRKGLPNHAVGCMPLVVVYKVGRSAPIRVSGSHTGEVFDIGPPLLGSTSTRSTLPRYVHLSYSHRRRGHGY